MKKLSAILAKKWEKHYAEVCGYGTIAIHFFLEDEGGWIFHQGMKSPK
jgi:hypothetical protein